MVDYIREWKEEAQAAFSEYKKRNYNCRRCEHDIINAYLDYLQLTKGDWVRKNQERFVNKGRKEILHEIDTIVEEWHLY